VANVSLAYVSKLETAWLNSLKIPKRCRQVKIQLKKKTVIVDALVKKHKTIYEFYGDFWHGNPKVFYGRHKNPVCRRTYASLYNKTITRERQLKAAGYKIVSMWESSLKRNGKKR
jgi:G:T-mismatch repair DNA endonuclease (very short patch repair protein)